MKAPQTTIELSRSALHLPLQGFVLKVTSGPDEGLTCTPDAERTIVGTDDASQLRLTDKTVSRFHCEVVTADDAVLVKDLGSRNGVSVDGVRVSQAWLHGGAVLTIGNTKVSFELATEPVKAPLSSRTAFGIMVGRSVAMRRAFSVLERAAASNATVLLGGETGTGKEAAAESLHREGARKEGPFIVIDCGAIPANLLESELFGHEKGAFTGASGLRTGAFEEADGGTLFLDEIGELEPELQPKLLRVLERREIKRVGSSAYFPVDVRIIAATNRNLRAEVNAKNFRSDLYYRLAVVEVVLPSLRERVEDLPILVDAILAQLAERGGAPIHRDLVRSRDFQAAVARHSWPGNVRELRNYVERCLALAEQAPLDEDAAADAATSELSVDTSVPLKVARDRWTATFERRYLEKVLAENGGNVSAAARAASVDRIHFYRLLWRNGLK